MKISQDKEHSAVWAWVLLSLAIVLAAVIRYHLIDVPFERDELSELLYPLLLNPGLLVDADLA